MFTQEPPFAGGGVWPLDARSVAICCRRRLICSRSCWISWLLDDRGGVNEEKLYVKPIVPLETRFKVHVELFTQVVPLPEVIPVNVAPMGPPDTYPRVYEPVVLSGIVISPVTGKVKVVCPLGGLPG